MRPVVPGGTVAVREVAVAAVMGASIVFTRRALEPAAVSNFVPVTVNDEPGMPIAGEKEAIVGDVLPTEKVAALVVVPAGAVTEIVPLVAPVGTAATIKVVVEEVTCAVVPLNLTVF